MLTVHLVLWLFLSVQTLYRTHFQVLFFYIIELLEKRQEVIHQMKELEAATESITTAFEDPDFQLEATSAR